MDFNCAECEHNGGRFLYQSECTGCGKDNIPNQKFKPRNLAEPDVKPPLDDVRTLLRIIGELGESLSEDELNALTPDNYQRIISLLEHSAEVSEHVI